MKRTIRDILKIPVEKSIEGIYFLSPYNPSKTHEEAYLKVREKEGRLLQDGDVVKLPNVPKDFPHSQEWRLRKQTAEYFLTKLAALKKPRIILDLGCGNGWFTAKMASISQTDVVGLDMNLPELKQAEQVFASDTLSFCYGNILEEPFLPEQFDIITINASLQYFSSISQLFTVLLRILKPDGKIHILDSPFYSEKEVANAKKRTEDYYLSMGCPEMAAHYFHHTYSDLTPYHCSIAKEKYPFLKRIFLGPRSPFPRIIIKK